MRILSSLVCGALCLVLANARSEEPRACSISAEGAPLRYTRLHQIPTVAPRDDVSHNIVTPGGMVFDAPKMVGATDILTIVARNSDVMCFRLLTYARDRHRCELAGVALKDSDRVYLFRENDAVLRFTFRAEHQVSVEPLGSGYQSQCEPSGKIDRATYMMNTNGVGH